MSVQDGGPAFPHDKYKKDPSEGWGTYAHGGMSLRDHLTGQALAGMGTWCPIDCEQHDFDRIRAAKARWAYGQADAMLAAR